MVHFYRSIMKIKLRYFILPVLIWAGFLALPVYQTGCTTAQTQATYQTLDAVGKTAKASMDSATLALKQGVITVAQWQKIANDYDNIFQPAYALAVAAAGAGTAQAPQSLVSQQTTFSASVSSLTATTK